MHDGLPSYRISRICSENREHPEHRDLLENQGLRGLLEDMDQLL